MSLRERFEKETGHKHPVQTDYVGNVKKYGMMESDISDYWKHFTNWLEALAIKQADELERWRRIAEIRQERTALALRYTGEDALESEIYELNREEEKLLALVEVEV